MRISNNLGYTRTKLDCISLKFNRKKTLKTCDFGLEYECVKLLELSNIVNVTFFGLYLNSAHVCAKLKYYRNFKRNTIESGKYEF